MNPPSRPRGDLRLVLAAGLSNGFATLTGWPFGFYAPLAVLAAGTGSFGQSLELSRQRLLGTLLGSAVLVGIQLLRPALPFPLAIGLGLALLRLLGQTFGLVVGYKVGGVVLVMGLTAHAQQLPSWIPLRLFWTLFGLLVAALSIRLFWPSQALAQVQVLWSELLTGLIQALRAPRLGGGRDRQSRLRSQLGRIRGLRPRLDLEFGTAPLENRSRLLLVRLEPTASLLIGALGDLRLSGIDAEAPAPLRALEALEVSVLAAVADRLDVHRRSLLRGSHGVLSAGPFIVPPEWAAADSLLLDPALLQLDPLRLRRLALNLQACRQAVRAVEELERGLSGGRTGFWGGLPFLSAGGPTTSARSDS